MKYACEYFVKKSSAYNSGVFSVLLLLLFCEYKDYKDIHDFKCFGLLCPKVLAIKDRISFLKQQCNWLNDLVILFTQCLWIWAHCNPKISLFCSLVALSIMCCISKECAQINGRKTNCKWAFEYGKLKPKVTSRPIG